MTTSYAKKKRNNLIALVSVLAVLIIAMIVVTVTKKDKDGTTDGSAETIYFTNLTKGDIVGIHFSYVEKDKKNESEKPVDIEFVFADSKWKYSADENFPLSQSTVSTNIIDNVARMEAGRVIEEPGDLAQYGFDEDIFKLELTMKDGKKIEIIAGVYNEAVGGYYIKKSDDDAVYLMGGTVEETLYDLYRSNVYEYAVMDDSLPAIDTDTLQFISIINGAGRVELTYKADGVDYDLVNSSYWYFQAPFSRLMPTVDDKIEDALEIVTGMSYALLADYDATDEELKAYGITDSTVSYSISYYVDVTEEGKTRKDLYTYKMEIGSLDESGQYYYVRPITSKGDLSIEASRKVSWVKKSAVENLLGIDPIDYMYRYANYISFDALIDGYMDITTPEGKYRVGVKQLTRPSIDGSTTVNYKEYSIDGKVLNEDTAEELTQFYKGFMMSFVKQFFYDDSKKKEVNPTYTVEYNLVNQSIEKQVVQYTQYDENFYQVTVDGYTDVMVSKQDIDDAFALFAAIQK